MGDESYLNNAEVQDLGSIECLEVVHGRRKYQGLSADVGKLPTYVEGGSSCLMLDTGDVYIFHGKSKNWMKI